MCQASGLEYTTTVQNWETKKIIAYSSGRRGWPLTAHNPQAACATPATPQRRASKGEKTMSHRPPMLLLLGGRSMSGCSGVSVGGRGYLIRGHPSCVYLPAPLRCYFPGGAWREATLRSLLTFLTPQATQQGGQPSNLSLGMETKAQRQQRTLLSPPGT